MQAGETSTAISCWQNPLRNWVQRPKPGAISRVVDAGMKFRMRGKIEAHHSRSVPPHFTDHLSPSSFQPSALPHKHKFCSTVGMATSPPQFGALSPQILIKLERAVSLYAF